MMITAFNYSANVVDSDAELQYITSFQLNEKKKKKQGHPGTVPFFKLTIKATRDVRDYSSMILDASVQLVEINMQ